MSDEKPRLTPNSEQALAEHVIEPKVIPKKIPDLDDIDGQTKALGGALASAMLTATDTPLHMLQPIVGALAAQLVAYGIRQTEHVDAEAAHAPAWVTDGVRQHSVKLPEQQQHTEAPPVVARTDVAPAPPKKVAKHQRAVKR